MKNSLLAVLTAAVLGACTAPLPHTDSATQLQRDVLEAQETAWVYCSTWDQCAKAFSLARMYVEQHSDTKVQRADDTTVSTYDPSGDTQVGLSVVRVPGTGQGATVRLTAACRGLLPESSFLSACAKRVIPTYTGFRPFIESKLN